MIGTSKVEYVQTDQLVATSYVKNSKAIGFLWGLFSVCFAIISIVVFVQPQWIGSDSSSYFGLWQHCSGATDTFACLGRLDDFASILSPTFRCATVFAGLGCIISILAVFALILFFCAPPPVGFNIVSWLIAIAAAFMITGLLVFPLGWDHPTVSAMCSNGSRVYSLGSCGLRWAYILGIIGALDGVVLSALGFTLASRHIKLLECRSGFQSASGSSRPLYYSVNESMPASTASVSCHSLAKKQANMGPYFVPIETDKDFHVKLNTSMQSSSISHFRL